MYVYNEIYKFTSVKYEKYQTHFVQIMLYTNGVFLFRCLRRHKYLKIENVLMYTLRFMCSHISQ